jgi:anti-anti-sigma factor
MEGLKIDVSKAGDNDELTVISPRGYIDATTVEEMEKKLRSLVAKKKFKIVVNFLDTEYVNSSGWGVFLRDLREIRDHEGDIVLANMTPDVHIVYETMEFSQIFKSFDSLEAAYKYFST